MEQDILGRSCEAMTCYPKFSIRKLGLQNVPGAPTVPLDRILRFVKYHGLFEDCIPFWTLEWSYSKSYVTLELWDDPIYVIAVWV